MVSASALVGLVVLVAVNTAIAALVVRFTRFQLATRWGAVLVTLFIVPILYVGTTTFFGGFLGLGDGLFDSTGPLLMFTWGLPFGLGTSIDLFWMPAPDDVELPARTEQ